MPIQVLLLKLMVIAGVDDDHEGHDDSDDVMLMVNMMKMTTVLQR